MSVMGIGNECCDGFDQWIDWIDGGDVLCRLGMIQLMAAITRM